jgi:hypothetical protein
MTDTTVIPEAVASVASSSVAASGSVAAAAANAEKVLKSVMQVEPTVAGIAGMFVPQVALVQPWILMAAPYLEQAFDDLSKGNNGDVLTSFLQLIQHITKGQPTSPILAGPAPASYPIPDMPPPPAGT